MPKAQGKIDEFVFVLLAGVILIAILMVAWTTPTEVAPKVSPSSVDMTTVIGGVEAFTLNISGKLTGVRLTASGDIASWIKFTSNNFDVSKSTLAEVKLTVPKTALLKTYTGLITVTSEGGSKTIPVTIVVEKEVIRALESRNIVLGDFFVGFTSGSKDLDSRQSVQVEKGYFSERSVNMVGSLTEKEFSILQGGEVRLVVEDSNKLGNLIVLFNDAEIFNKKVGPGEIAIPIRKNSINKTNVVNIKAENPGFIFWATTLYQLRSAKLSAGLDGSFSKETSFRIRSAEAANLDSIRLAYKVEDFSSDLPELTIRLNDQIIFKEKPSTTSFDKKFETGILGDSIILNEGDNKLFFSFDEEASYSVTNAIVTVFYKS